MMVALASIVFIIAVVFWSGFILGAHGGGHEHGHDGFRHQSEMSREDSTEQEASHGQGYRAGSTEKTTSTVQSQPPRP